MSEEKTKEPLSDFLHAKSMLTPGICGALVMVMTNALGTAFSISGSTRSVVCLGLSFLAGTLVFASGVKKLWPGLAFYVFNSLIIFSAAAGVNFSGQVASSSPVSPLVITNTLVQTQRVVQVVSNGQTVTKTTLPPMRPPVLMTNRLPASAQAIKVSPKFFEKWR